MLSFTELNNNEFDIDSPTYKDLKAKLQTQKDKGEKLMLCIHAAGTTYKADQFCATRDALNHSSKPSIFLDGPGAEVDVQPVERSKNSLEKIQQKFLEMPSLFSLINPSHVNYSKINVSMQTQFMRTMDELTGKKILPTMGIIWGCGKKEHAEILVNLLIALKNDGLLPEEILVAGHSRGAVACNYFINSIFKKFPQIYFHAVLTDPVPGDIKDDEKDIIVCENVKTFNIFYARQEAQALFKPNHIEKYKFVSSKTVVMSFNVPGTTHFTIAGEDKFTYWAIRQMVTALTATDPKNFKMEPISQEAIEAMAKWDVTSGSAGGFKLFSDKRWTPELLFDRAHLKFEQLDLNKFDTLPKHVQETWEEITKVYKAPFEKYHFNLLLGGLKNSVNNERKRIEKSGEGAFDYVDTINQLFQKFHPYTLNDEQVKTIKQQTELVKFLEKGYTQHEKNTQAGNKNLKMFGNVVLKPEIENIIKKLILVEEPKTTLKISASM